MYLAQAFPNYFRRDPKYVGHDLCRDPATQHVPSQRSAPQGLASQPWGVAPWQIEG